MTPAMISDRLRNFLVTLETVGPEGEKDAFANEVIETGGTYLDPQTGPRPASHLFEIQLHGISAFGPTEPDARRNWKRIAHGRFGSLAGEAPAPPFPQPCNHAEEIANITAAHAARA